jgi:hypothetical protein
MHSRWLPAFLLHLLLAQNMHGKGSRYCCGSDVEERERKERESGENWESKSEKSSRRMRSPEAHIAQLQIVNIQHRNQANASKPHDHPVSHAL